MNFDDWRHQCLRHFDNSWLRCWLHLDGRRHQRLEQRCDGRYRRQHGCRCFDHSYWSLRYRRDHRSGSNHNFLRIVGLFFEHCRLEFVQRRFNLDHPGRRFDLWRKFLGDVLQQAVQIRLKRQLRARGGLKRPVHGCPPAGASLLAKNCRETRSSRQRT
ncbi:hypothetical protein D3C87_1415190 [compost metagenome]